MVSYFTQSYIINVVCLSFIAGGTDGAYFPFTFRSAEEIFQDFFGGDFFADFLGHQPGLVNQ
jgi:hypothetical protein